MKELPAPTWDEVLLDKYGDKGDERFGLAKHNNTILNNIIDDFRTILTSHEATIRQEIGEQLEEIRFDAHNGKDVYHKIVSLLAIINPMYKS